MQRRNWRVFAVAAMAAGVLGVVAGAQSVRPQDGDILGALLAEVRGLRQAMEQIAMAGPRVQLALGRLQLQEQRLNTMIRRVETLRDAIASAEKENAGTQAQLATVEAALKDDSRDMSEADRGMLPQMMTSLRKAAAAGAAEVQRLHAEEAFLQQQIAIEQGRWDEINRSLEELERGLARR
jgi:chromosome segregation ATPase